MASDLVKNFPALKRAMELQLEELYQKFGTSQNDDRPMENGPKEEDSEDGWSENEEVPESQLIS